MSFPPLQAAGIAVLMLLALAALAPMLHRSQRLLIGVAFTIAAVASLVAALAGAVCVARGSVSSVTLLLGLPDLPFTLRLDPLAGFFLVVIGLLSLFVSIYSLGYVRGFLGQRSVTRLAVFYALFLAGMLLVVLANDALFFLVSWELMAVASYFLVVFEDERVENRRAGFLYLVVAHVGAVAILLSFGIMAGLGTGFSSFSGYSFDAMRQASLTPGWATAAFLLAFFGFAAKAGVIPLHVWLPEAHPVAPSNVSALMSGVMLKTGAPERERLMAGAPLLLVPLVAAVVLALVGDRRLAPEINILGSAVTFAAGLGLALQVYERGSFMAGGSFFFVDAFVDAFVSGDVHARAWVRVLEVRESVRLIRYIVAKLPGGPILAPLEAPPPDSAGFAAVEGWRDEIVYWLQSGPGGEANRCMVRDPSSLNWVALEQAVPGNIVPDFPLCNKSFNQSYSGHDL